jgi:type II secretory pathway pseudopilin PulG
MDDLHMLRKFFKKKFKAFSLVEVLFAVVLLGAGISTVLISLSGQLSHVNSSSSQLQASSIANEGLDAARSIRDANWSNLATGQHGLAYANGAWSFSATSDTQNGFNRTVTVTEISPNERNVAVNVVWKGTGGNDRSLAYSTILTNWRNLDSTPAGGDLTGDWHNPVFIGNMLDFGTGFRGIAEDIDGQLLFVAGFGEITTANELAVIDVSNPLAPRFRGSINTGTGFNKVAVDPARHYVFAANASKTSQLQIIDATNPDALKLKKQFAISGNTHTGRSIDLVGNTVYLGTEGPDTAEFFVIDVTNVLSPVVKGSVSVGNDVNDVAAGDNLAFTASDVDNREVGIINVTDPSHPVVDAWVDLPGTNDVEDLYYDSATKRLFVGRKAVTGTNTPEMVILDVSTPTNPQIIGQLEYDVNLDSIYTQGNLMIITALGDLEFKAYNISNLPTIIYYGGIDFGVDDVPTDIIYSDNVFYITVWQRYALRIISAY